VKIDLEMRWKLKKPSKEPKRAAAKKFRHPKLTEDECRMVRESLWTKQALVKADYCFNPGESERKDQKVMALMRLMDKFYW